MLTLCWMHRCRWILVRLYSSAEFLVLSKPVSSCFYVVLCFTLNASAPVELAMIMDRLYGGVCYAGIDTDPELKYPKGAGRVAFSNQQSYIAAISARFVQLQHGDIEKRVSLSANLLTRLSRRFFVIRSKSSLMYWTIRSATSVRAEDVAASLHPFSARM